MAVEAFNSRYSTKYFGAGKGISSLLLNANYISLLLKIISLNEYEGHRVLELLVMNESNITPKFHSTDTHGTNQLNFILLELCGYQFAPRYKNLSNRKNIIFGTKDIKKYNSNFLLKPVDKIDINIILEEEMNIKRIINSILQKKVSVKTIVQKLYDALWMIMIVLHASYILASTPWPAQDSEETKQAA